MLPNDLEKRLRIKKDLERCVNILHEIDMLASDIVDIAQVLQDDNIMKAKDFKSYVKAKYEGDTLLEKAHAKVSELEDNLADIDILNKVK